MLVDGVVEIKVDYEETEVDFNSGVEELGFVLSLVTEIVKTSDIEEINPEVVLI